MPVLLTANCTRLCYIAYLSGSVVSNDWLDDVRPLCCAWFLEPRLSHEERFLSDKFNVGKD